MTVPTTRAVVSASVRPRTSCTGCSSMLLAIRVSLSVELHRQCGAIRRHQSKDDRDRAEAQFVAIPQRGAAADSLAAHIGPVLTAQIFERHVRAIDDDARVAAGHSGHVKADMRVRARPSSVSPSASSMLLSPQINHPLLRERRSEASLLRVVDRPRRTRSRTGAPFSRISAAPRRRQGLRESRRPGSSGCRQRRTYSARDAGAAPPSKSLLVMLGEQPQQIEGFRRQRYRIAAARQQTAVGVERPGSKCHPHIAEN